MTDTAAPNPHRNLRAWYEIRLGGRLLKATLTAVNGNKIVHEWSTQKPTGKSGAEQVFKGSKPPGPFKCELDGSDEESFDDILEIKKQTAPVPGLGTGGAAKTSTPTGYTSGVGSPPAASSSSTSSGSSGTSGFGAGSQAAGASSASSSSSSSSSSGKKSSTPDPGPRPPTLTIENGFFQFLDVTAVSLGSLEGPKVDASTNRWWVEIEFVAQAPPKPAGVGAASPPKPGDGFSSGAQSAGAAPQNPAASAQAEQKKAQQEASPT